MPQPKLSVPCHVRLSGALVLAGGLASAGLAGNGVQWRLWAQVPVMCAIIAVETPADRPSSLAIVTSCNAERFQLVLHPGEGTVLRAARSSAGQVAISGSAVTITSARPGHALTTLDLAAPVSPGQFAVTLHPI